MPLDDLYREILLDHYQSPRNKRRLSNPDVEVHGSNPFCGDEMDLELVLRDGRVSGLGFQGRGCSISQASASMMTEALMGKTLQEVEQVVDAFRNMMLNKDSRVPDDLGDLEALQGVRRYPVRVKCALLAWNTLVQGLEKYSIEKERVAGPSVP